MGNVVGIQQVGPWQKTPSQVGMPIVSGSPMQIGQPIFPQQPESEKGKSALKGALIGAAAGAVGGAVLSFVKLPFLPHLSLPIGAIVGGLVGAVIGGVAGFAKGKNDDAKLGVFQLGSNTPPPPFGAGGVGLPPQISLPRN